MYDNIDSTKVDENFQNLVFESLAGVYVSLHAIDMEYDTFKTLKPAAFLEPLLNSEENASTLIKRAARKLISEEFILGVLKYLDLETLNDRMEGTKILRYEVHAKDGHWVRINFIEAERAEDGSLKTVLLGITRIDAEKEKEVDNEKRLKQMLKDQSEMYNEMLQNQSTGVIAYNLQSKKIQMMNAAALAIFGWDCVGSDSINYVLEKIISPKKDLIIEKINNIKLMDDELSFEFAIKRDEKNFIFVLGHTKVILLSNQDEIVICSFTNITKIKKMERELVVMSQTDGLTQINNRVSGEKRIEKYLREGQVGMFWLLDVDKFKTINDNFGHTTGDAVLVEIAKCLKRSLRDNDVVMRLGGDEFAAFAIGVQDRETADLCLTRFYNNLSKIDILALGDRKVTVSLGAVFCHEKTNEQGKIIRDATGHSFIEDTFDTLYQKADTVMYSCKRTAPGRFDFYDSEKENK